MRTTTLGVSVLLVMMSSAAQAQTSTSFQLVEHSFNAGGVPSSGGLEVSSTSFRITLASIGDVAMAAGVSSASYQMDVGSEAAYPPPGEVQGLLFGSATDLSWSADASAGVYQLYRELMSNLAGLGYGQCEQQDLTTTSTTDIDAVPSNDGYFYLVTVRNRLGEEGTKGSQADMTERLGAICP